MTTYGYTLSSEEHGPTELVANARAAEEAGLAFASISDHYHPWTSAQGHSPFVWSVLGAVAQATERLELAIGVTCPIVRIHPAIIAQASATTSLLAGGRLTLGVGSGEALNEHIVGTRWPRATIRQEMLEEAIEVIRALWTGSTTNHRGRWFEVENARLFDPPAEPIPLVVSGFGPAGAELAARVGDGYWCTGPEGELLDAYAKAGGAGPRYGQINVCWGPDEGEARELVHGQWPNGGIAGQLAQDLPTWHHFEQATAELTEDQTVGSVPCGPAVEPVVASVRTYLDAGYDHLYFHQIGPDQAGFLRFWQEELGPALSETE